MKLLLIDDDKLLRDMYATKFSASGDSVTAVDSGEKAISAVADAQYDAVVMDMVMPGTHGVALITGLLSGAAGTPPSVIVLSNLNEPSDIDSAKAAGAIGYLTKADLVPSEVVKKVHDIINQSK